MEETKDPQEGASQGVAVEMEREEAIRLINAKIPEGIRADLGGYVRSFCVVFRDGRQVFFIVLERGYYVHFMRQDIPAEGGVYLSGEAAFAFGFLYALFGREEDEEAFNREIAPEQREMLDAALAEVEGAAAESPTVRGVTLEKALEIAEGALKDPDALVDFTPEEATRDDAEAESPVPAFQMFVDGECNLCGLPPAAHTGADGRQCPPKNRDWGERE